MISKYIKGFITIILYFILPSIFILLYESFTGNNINLNNNYILAILNLIISITILLILLLINPDIIKNGIDKIKKNKFKYLYEFINKLIIYIVIFFSIKILLGILESVIFNIFNIEYQDVANQIAVENEFKSAPLVMGISACLIAPFLEELVFRYSIRQLIKNKRVFVFVSGFIFGLAHIVNHDLILFNILIIGIILDIILNNKKLNKNKKIIISICASILLITICILVLIKIYSLNSLISEFKVSELIGGIMYVGLGLYLAYIYSKENDYYLNVLVHSFNNLFSFISYFKL